MEIITFLCSTVEIRMFPQDRYQISSCWSSSDFLFTVVTRHDLLNIHRQASALTQCLVFHRSVSMKVRFFYDFTCYTTRTQMSIRVARVFRGSFSLFFCIYVGITYILRLSIVSLGVLLLFCVVDIYPDIYSFFVFSLECLSFSLPSLEICK